MPEEKNADTVKDAKNQAAAASAAPAADPAAPQKQAETGGFTFAEALAQPDGEVRQGKVVTADDLVKTVYADHLTDPITLKEYNKEKWADAVPSAFLDGQLRAGKIILRD